MTKRIRLTKKGFRGWLAGKPGGAVVGKAHAVRACPLAQYLRHKGMDTPDLSTVSFGPAAAYWRERTPMPQWASFFIPRIDSGRFCGQPITASQALAVLDGKEAKT